MTVIATDSNRLSTVVKHEYQPNLGFCRDAVVANDVAATWTVGAVLGKTLAGGVGAMTTSVATPCTISAITVAGYSEVGTYKVVMTSSTAFNVYKPSANGAPSALVGVGVLGTATVPANAGGLTFTLTTAGSPAAGDTYFIAVTGTYKYKLVDATATDGTQVAAAIYVNDGNGISGDLALAANTDTSIVAITRGPVIVSKGALQFAATVNSAPLLATAYAQLKSVGIIAETAN